MIFSVGLGEHDGDDFGPEEGDEEPRDKLQEGLHAHGCGQRETWGVRREI